MDRDDVSTTIEQTLRALISDWSVAAILLRGQRVIEFNPAAAEWLGETSGQLHSGYAFPNLVAAADQAALRIALSRAGQYPIGTTVSLACAQAGNCVAELTLIGGWESDAQLVLALAANPSEVPGGFGRDWRFLRHVIDTSSAMIFVKDREGRFLLANRGLAKAYNLAVEEVEGRLNASLHSNPEEIEAFLRDDREVMDSRQSKLIVAEPVTYSDGSVHWYSTVKTPLFLDSAHCDHVLGIATNIDELKAAERELQQSEYLLRSIIDNTSAVVFVKGLDGRYLRINKRFTDLFHVSNEALLGRTDYDLFPPDVADAVRAADQDVFRAGKALEFEEVVPQDDGLHTYLVLKFPLRNPGGETYAICGIATDITERKRVQRRLERHLAEQRAILDNELVGIVTVKNRTIVWANPAFEKLLGYGSGQLNGVPTRQTYPSENAYRELGAAAYPVIEAGGIFRTQFELVREDGAAIWVDVSGAQLDRENGESLWSVVDITERKRAAQVIADREARFRMLAAATFEGISISEAGRFVDGNDQLFELLGYTREEMQQLPVERLIHQPDRERVLEQAFRGGEGIIQFAVLHKDGHLVQVEARSQMLDYAGRLIRITALRDITARKHIEDEMRIASVAFESQNGMLITDPQGVILRVNPAFTRLTGYTPEEAIGKTPALLNSGKQDRRFFEKLWSSVRDQGYWQGEIWNKRKNGQIYAELLTITAVRTPKGEVTHYVGSFSDITVNKEAEAEIHRLAYYDPLTHLPNRRLLQERLGHAIAAKARGGDFGALYLLDLDNFKILNDTRGHDVGDLLLAEVAHRLRSVVREFDTVARLGGDEFVVLIEELAGEKEIVGALAQQVGDKLRQVIEQPFNLKGSEYHCRLSIGVTLLGGGNSVEEVFKQADLALYEAKSKGRNTMRFFDPAMQAALDRRSALEQELRRALDLHQFLLYYQPQVDAERRIIGAEVLLRWQHAGRGLVAPDEFIPLAEDTGVIVPLGYWVIETACGQLRTWALVPALRDLRLAVNVSSRQFRQTDFVPQVTRILETSGADATRLKFELTESAVLEDIEDTIEKMDAIRKLGVGLSIDDFGTGYSSLSYLARLPLSQLKIDRSFVHNVPGKHSDETITRTIITMGQALAMEVLAEGVETEAQRGFLEVHGCCAFQGFMFHRPMPLTQFEALM